MNVLKRPPYWTTFDEFVDIPGLLSLHEYLCYAITMSTRNLCFSGRIKPETDAVLDTPIRGIGNAMQVFHTLPETHPVRVACKDMSLQQQMMYVALRFKSRCEGELVPIIIRKKEAPLEGHPGLRGDKRRTLNYPFFTEFFDWVEKQKIFYEYGRTIAFVTPPYQRLKPHSDGLQLKENPSEFIWVRTDLGKQFSVFQDDQIRTPVDGHVVWFNGGYKHKAERCNFFTFSIRVDGFFTDEFKKKIEDRG